MDCCSPEGLEKIFTDKKAEKNLKKYKKKGPDPSTFKLLNAIPDEGVKGASVMDIGGGVGAIQMNLLNRGASNVVSIDASKGYLAVSRKEAKRLHYEDKIQYHYGNYLAHAPSLPDADIVTLDKVLCCSHEPYDIIRASASKCNRYYGIVVPRDRFSARFMVFFTQIGMWISGNPFRFHVYNIDKMTDAVCDFGFKSPTSIKHKFWLSLLF